MDCRQLLFAEVILPVPLPGPFDYKIPDSMTDRLVPGVRVRVPFGSKKLVGLVTVVKDSSTYESRKVKNILEQLDSKSLIDPQDLDLGLWAARYYQGPTGEAISMLLPPALRKGGDPLFRGQTCWMIPQGWEADQIPHELKRAPKQKAIWEGVQRLGGKAGREQLLHITENPTPTLNALVEKGLLLKKTVSPFEYAREPKKVAPELTGDQVKAIESIKAEIGQFSAWLLEGVTGSGKTEVYLQLIQQVVASGQQVIVLVPEIGLTPQLISRFESRLDCCVAAYHSELSESERLNIWLGCQQGKVKVLVGTRSSLFTPMPKLGLLIVDEEHDASFKQQDGLRISARDIAVRRAQQREVPIVLGTATPSLETLANVEETRYHVARLPVRANQSNMPSIQLIDVRSRKLEHGLSSPLIDAMKKHLEKGNQVLVFLNRRGYSPVLMCHACGWIATCHRCDVRMTYHQKSEQLRCHHCDSVQRRPEVCPECQATEFIPLGKGTERVEQALNSLFPDYTTARIDRDTTRGRDSFAEVMHKAAQGEIQILLGTQMLAKGHHLPGVTLSAILDCDSGLFSMDFRALERMGQMITQVSGRAGRGEQPGEVLIQTHQPEHPLLQLLLGRGYHQFAMVLLRERQQAGLPPYAFQAIIRAEAHDANKPKQFLETLVNKLTSHDRIGIDLFGPFAALIGRRAGYHRAFLVVQSGERKILHQRLRQIRLNMENHSQSRKVKWLIDVDPQEVF